MNLVPPTNAFKWPTLPLDPDKLHEYLNEGMYLHIPYLWGGKDRMLEEDPPVAEFPMTYHHGIDCSGFSRAAIFFATYGQCLIPDGSVNQHQWCRNAGLKPSSVEALALLDNATRICFIEPEGDEAGHVFIVRNRKTAESHGGKGIDSRSCNAMTSTGQTLAQRTAAVYVLALGVFGS